MKRNQTLLKVRRAVRKYWDQHGPRPFDPGAPAVRLHEPTFGPDEICAALECLLTTHVTMGPKVRRFEEEFSARVGQRHAVMVNSGSSANLLAISALTNPDRCDRLMPGDEVIVPALSWSTTVWPLVQHQLVPVVVDIDPRTLNIDPNELERAVGPKTRAAMIVHVYGNPCDMTAIMDVCRRKSLVLVEDCCEAMGASFGGQSVGRFGVIGTFSLYYSHHITTLEGGMCVSEDFELVELMRILRAHGWVREVEDQKRWLLRYPEIPPRFLFVNSGYNLRATELQGAMGSVQLPKLGGFVRTRAENAAFFRREFSRYGEFVEVQEETLGGSSSWFGLPITIRTDAPFTRDELTQYLEVAGVETRPLICGNIARQPGLELYPHKRVGDLRHADHAMKNGFSFGNHQAVSEAARRYVADRFHEFMATRKVRKERCAS